MRYRTKPTYIDAPEARDAGGGETRLVEEMFQVHSANVVDLSLQEGPGPFAHRFRRGWVFRNLSAAGNQIEVHPGDFIVTLPSGERQIVNGEAFLATYEEA